MRHLRPIPATARIIARPRLDALLERGGDLPLTLVVACPGSGKRTAVHAWLTTRGQTAIWCPAAVGATDVAGFARLLADEMERWRPYPGRQLRAALETDDPPGPAAVAAALRPALAKLAQPLWLVLDAGGTTSSS